MDRVFVKEDNAIQKCIMLQPKPLPSVGGGPRQRTPESGTCSLAQNVYFRVYVHRGITMLYFASLVRRIAAGIHAGRSEGVVIMDACVSVGNHWLVFARSSRPSRSRTAFWAPDIFVSLLAPELLEPLLTCVADPAACKVHQQVAVAVAHVVAALDVGVELALGVDANVIAY